MVNRYFISESGSGKVTTTDVQYQGTLKDKRYTEVSKLTYEKYWGAVEEQAEKTQRKMARVREDKQFITVNKGTTKHPIIVKQRVKPKQYYIYSVEQNLNYGVSGRITSQEDIRPTVTPKGTPVPILSPVNPLTGQNLTETQLKGSPVVSMVPGVGYSEGTVQTETQQRPKGFIQTYKDIQTTVASKTTQKILPPYEKVRKVSIYARGYDYFSQKEQKGATKYITNALFITSRVKKGAYQTIRNEPITNILTFGGGSLIGAGAKALNLVKPWAQLSTRGKILVGGTASLYTGTVAVEIYKTPGLGAKSELIGKRGTQLGIFTSGYVSTAGSYGVRPVTGAERVTSSPKIEPMKFTEGKFNPSDYFIKTSKGAGGKFYAVNKVTGKMSPIERGEVFKFSEIYTGIKRPVPSQNKFTFFGGKRGSMALTPKTQRGQLSIIKDRIITPVMAPTKLNTNEISINRKPTRTLDVVRRPITRRNQYTLTKVNSRARSLSLRQTAITSTPRNLVISTRKNIMVTPSRSLSIIKPSDIIKKPPTDIIRRPTTDINNRPKTDIIKSEGKPPKPPIRPRPSFPFPDVPVPPFFYMGGKGEGGGGLLSGFGKRTSPRSQIKKYVPSLTAITLNIRGQRPGDILSGLEQRPITSKGGTKSKKRNKKKVLI